MRLKKFPFAAAASLLAGVASLPAATVTLTDNATMADLTPVDYAFGDTIQVRRDQTLTIDVLGNESKTYAGLIQGRVDNPNSVTPIVINGDSGNVVKTGEGTLQLSGYSESDYYRTSITVDARRVLSDANQGQFRIKAGTVEVSGYINQRQRQNFNGDLILPPNLEDFLGFRSTVLEGGARLSFSNTLLNVPNDRIIFDGVPDEPFQHPGVARLNMVMNLMAGDNNNQANTSLNVGTTDDMRLIVHSTDGSLGSVGRIDGRGNVYKTGVGEFRVLNRGDFSGEVHVAGGILVLGNETNTINNVLGNMSGFIFDYFRGEDTLITAYTAYSQPGISEFKPAYVPQSEPDTQRLRINGTQTIRNLQYAFDNSEFNQTYLIRRGADSRIDIADNATLILQQDLNGYYTGGVVSGNLAPGAGGGDIIKRGVSSVDAAGVYERGALALFVGTAIYRNLIIEEGTLFTDGSGLGFVDVFLREGGELKFVQNAVSSLNARLHGVGKIDLDTSARMYNNPLDGGERAIVTVGNGEIGTLEAVVRQDDFFGDILVRGGIQLRFGGAGETFASARSVTLFSGPNQEETALAFNDTSQTFHNFSGEKQTRIDLGQGNFTAIQDRDLAYEGKITGFGGFIKDGGGAFVFSGRDALGNSTVTYSGATVVKRGTLGLNGENATPLTSGLVLSGGGLVGISGSQTFGALFGVKNSRIDLGGGNLTIGVSAARLAQIQSGASVRGLVPDNTFYFATEGSTAVTGYTADTTRAFLQRVTADAGLTAEDVATLNGLAFAGSISGGGDLIKQGVERLILTGTSNYTGKTRVIGGTLQIDHDAILSSSEIIVSAAATLAIKADTGSSATFTQKISGAGDFEKLGAGELLFGADIAQYQGATKISEGTLALTLGPLRTGDISVALPATLKLNQPTDVAHTGAVSGTGLIIKLGSGTLTFSTAVGSTAPGFFGGISVQEGAIIANSAAVSLSSLTIAAGANFTANITSLSAITGALSGAGALNFSGDAANPTAAIVTFGVSNPDFTGAANFTNARVLATRDRILPNAGAVTFTNSTYDLNGTTQTVGAVSGDEASSVLLNGGTLEFSLEGGLKKTFLMRLVGNGTVVKNGEGLQLLKTFAGAAPWTGATIVNAGTLDATIPALGDSTVTVNEGGVIALRNDDATTPGIFARGISGVGSVGKTGVGRIDVTDTLAGLTGGVRVLEGELRVNNGAGTLGGRAFPSVEVATAGVYAVVMQGDLVHDSGNLANSVRDALNDGGVLQHGSLAVEGARTLSFINGQSYTGNTILRAGATLDLVASTGLGGVLNGLAGEVGTTVRTGGAALTVVQNVSGLFSGTFDAPTDLTIQGGAKLSFDANTGNIGALIVDGGKLALDASLTHAIALQNNGVFFFDTTTTNAFYAGTVSGTGDVFKTGANTLDLSGDLSGFTATGKIGVDQGRLIVTLADIQSAPNITGLASQGTGELALSVDAGDARKIGGVGGFDISLTGDGGFVKTGAGALLFGDSTLPYFLATGGPAQVEQGVLGGYFATAGDLRVLAGGTLAPGNSPGTVTVNGDFSNAGTLAIELTQDAAVHDKIVVNGSATLLPGTVFDISQFGGGKIQRGVAYKIITATGAITAAEGSYTLAPGSRRAIIVTPDRNAGPGILNGKGAANAVVIYDSPPLADTPGYRPHDGLGAYLALADELSVDDTGKPNNAIGAALVFAPASELTSAVNNFSPLAYASLYGMSRDTGLAQENNIRERLEQRRYDFAGTAPQDWEVYLSGSGSFAFNQNSVSAPTFNYQTFGGLVGLDKRLGEDDNQVIGIAAGYDNGIATIHDAGGKIIMNRARAMIYTSTMITSAWFVEGGLSAGLGLFDAKRGNLLGRNRTDITGHDFGLNVNTGTVVGLSESFHLTPRLGFSYDFLNFKGAQEKGSAAPLQLDGWNQSSLRATLGSGFGWYFSTGDWKWKLGGDVAYHHEFLDTDSNLSARFTGSTPSPTFSIDAAALPADSISVGPDVALFFDDATSLSATMAYQYGFDGRNYTGFNITFRKRF